MVDFAEAAIECRNPEFARPLFERLEPWRAQIPATGGSALAPVSYYLGGLAWVMGRYDDANAFFEQAMDLSRQMRAKFFLAQTELRWGQMLIERRAPGDLDRARELLASALVGATAHGYGTVHRRTVGMLEQLG
jgi:tetratricopeptide (TPR) repeat protein